MEDNKFKELYNEVINIDKEKLVSYLKCTLCNGIFRTPTTINECMHTFCKSCIYKYFYSNSTNDKCPTCGIKLGGKPLDTLIFDSSISVLIEILFPEFEKLDKDAMKQMYQAFRDNKQNLPGDEEVLGDQKPSVKVYLYPFKTDQPYLALPKLAAPQLVLQSILPVETLKKYLSSKFPGVQPEEISLLYKNQDIPDHYKLRDIEIIYKFNETKNIIHYQKKMPLSVTPNNLTNNI